MKFASDKNITDFVSKLIGDRDPDPTPGDRLLGSGIVGGGMGANMLLSEILGSSTAPRPIDSLEQSPDTTENALKHLRDNRDMSAEVKTVPSRLMEENLGSSANANYTPSQDRIYRTPDTPAHVLLHEAGHASDKDHPAVRALRKSNIGGRWTPVLGAGAALGMGGTGNETLESLAPAAVAALHAPQLLEEGRAWLNADRALRAALSAQENPPTGALKSMRGRAAGGLAGYGLAAAGNILGAYKLPDIIDHLANR